MTSKTNNNINCRRPQHLGFLACCTSVAHYWELRWWCRLQGRMGVGLGWSPPTLKPTKVTLFTIILYNSENNIRDKVTLSSVVLSQQCCEMCFISLTVAKPLWDLTSKYYWNRPLPELTGVIRPWWVVNATECKYWKFGQVFVTENFQK